MTQSARQLIIHDNDGTGLYILSPNFHFLTHYQSISRFQYSRHSAVSEKTITMQHARNHFTPIDTALAMDNGCSRRQLSAVYNMLPHYSKHCFQIYSSPSSYVSSALDERFVCTEADFLPSPLLSEQKGIVTLGVTLCPPH